MRKKLGGTIIPAPLALTPASWPSAQYHLALSIQPLFQKLVNNIVNERKWLDAICKSLSKDEFVSRLYRVWQECRVKSLRFTIFRSDYMLHQGLLKQVELNTISVAFAQLSSLAIKFHHKFSNGNVPMDLAAPGIIIGMKKAVELFESDFSVKGTLILLVTQGDESNTTDINGIVDQFDHVVLTLAEISQKCSIDHQGNLSLNERVVSLVYFRAGYAPCDYPTELEWTARSIIENSNAIAVPDIATHLAGMKKVQQELVRPEILARFIDSKEERDLLSQTFMEMHSLEMNEEGETSTKVALGDPERWVIKPQREGGGNNVYGSNIPQFLNDISREMRATHILMERIKPIPEVSILLRDGNVWSGETISELGIFGILLIKDNISILNDATGYLVRTKPANVEEGGVATGYAYLNAINLTS
jgi:glutathione synthase